MGEDLAEVRQRVVEMRGWVRAFYAEQAAGIEAGGRTVLVSFRYCGGPP